MKRLLFTLAIIFVISSCAFSAIRLVPTQYSTINAAVAASNDGDVIILAPGRYTLPDAAGPDGVEINKNITIQSMIDPANPDWETIESTIIDCGGGKYGVNSQGKPRTEFKSQRAFHITGGKSPSIIGITIENGYFAGAVAGMLPIVSYDCSWATPQWHVTINVDEFCPDMDPVVERQRAESGDSADGDGYGGAIFIDNASPVITCCLFRDNAVCGGVGADGENGFSTPVGSDLDAQWGGHGGHGWGNGFGGAIAIQNAASKPVITKCKFYNNMARGGIAGNGGRGGDARGSGEAGGGGDGGSIGVPDTATYALLNPNRAPSIPAMPGNGTSRGLGGAIWAAAQVELVIEDCEFEGNEATNGIIGVGGTRSYIGSDGSDLLLQTTGWSGSDGGVLDADGDGALDSLWGGAVYLDGQNKLTMNNSVFKANEAYYMLVGEIVSSVDPFIITLYDFAEAGYDDLDEASFNPSYGSNNEAGAGLYDRGFSVITLDNCDFYENLGGAIWCGEDTSFSLTVSDPTERNDISGNYRDGAGGGIYLRENHPGSTLPAIIADTSFSGNRANGDGAGLFMACPGDIIDCTFSNNWAQGGYEGGGMAWFNWSDSDVINISGTNFGGNKSRFGGGLYMRQPNCTMTECYIGDNTAQSGGGLYIADGSLDMNDVIVMDNTATDGEANGNIGGGGMLLASVNTTLTDCLITGNRAQGDNGYGGAIRCYGGQDDYSIDYIITNCVISDNYAEQAGGGLTSEIYADVDIESCTIADNSTDGMGGGIYTFLFSQLNVDYSILHNCNNGAVYKDLMGGFELNYNLFSANPQGDLFADGSYYDATGINGFAGSDNNINGSASFVSGTFGSYYLGAASDAIDAGDILADSKFDPATYTTTTDDLPDAANLDLGYHYKQASAVGQKTLTISTDGNGGVRVDEGAVVSSFSQSFTAGVIVEIEAVANGGYRLKSWTGGTVNDGSVSSYNTVLMNTDKHIHITFNQPRVIHVGPDGDYDYATIEDAVFDALPGDIIEVSPGVWRPHNTLEISKPITIRSINPNDPDVVASTIIDGRGDQGGVMWAMRAFRFTSDVRRDTVVEGFTLRNFRWAPAGIAPSQYPCEPGGDGMDIYGAIMSLHQYASPTIRKCIFEQGGLFGVNGGRGHDAGDGYHASRGGWGGRAFGGAVYCGRDTDPLFEECIFRDNYVRGGDGGNGGDAFNANWTANYGGMWSQQNEWAIECTTVDIISGDLWAYWGYEENYKYYTGFGGAIYCDTGSTATFEDCEIYDNSADGPMSGTGGITTTGRAEYPQIAYRLPSYGGGAFCQDGSDVKFIRCEFRNNSATVAQATDFFLDPYLGYGGGVCAHRSAKVTFEQCDFTENQASVGGAVNWDNGAEINFTDCHFENNTALQGGGLLCTDASGLVSDCNFISNFANLEVPTPAGGVVQEDPEILGRGGGVCSLSSLLDIINTDLENNVTNGFGGGIYMSNGNLVEPVVSNCLIKGNTAETGGGIYSFNDNSILLDCIVQYNEATDAGGGVRFGGSDENQIFTPSLFNCLVTNNKAGREGGGVSVSWYNDPDLTNCTIADNRVYGHPGYGGGIAAANGCVVDVKDSIVYRNNASVGAQLCIADGDSYINPPSALNVEYSNVELGAEELPLDFILMIDATGSMLDDIDAVKEASDMLLTEIMTSTPDSRVAIVSYRDYPEGGYGFEGDWVYRYEQGFTTDVESAQAAIQAVEAGGGVDWPESLYSALMSVLNPAKLEADLTAADKAAYIDTEGALGNWRSGKVNRVIIVMSDAPAHDPEPFIGYTAETIIAEATETSQKVGIYPVFIGTDEQALNDLGELAEGTGGTVFGALEATDVVPAIMQAIDIITNSIPIYVGGGGTLNGKTPGGLADWLGSFDTASDFPEWESVFFNISDDPEFLGEDLYFLKQERGGQLASQQSPCVNAGSDLAVNVGLDNYSTASNGAADIDFVDLGFHRYIPTFEPNEYYLTINELSDNMNLVADPGNYHSVDPYTWFTTVKLEVDPPADSTLDVQWTGTDDDNVISTVNYVTMDGNKTVSAKYAKVGKTLTISVDGQGKANAYDQEGGYLGQATVDTPLELTLALGTMVDVVAAYDANDYRVKMWQGFDESPAWGLEQNTVTVYDNKSVIVIFESNVVKNLLVPSQFETIAEAVAYASPNDHVVLERSDTPYIVNDPEGIDFEGKPLIIRSENPYDPQIVAETVLDCNGSKNNQRRAFHFHSGEDANTKILGITIKNGYYSGAVGEDYSEPGYLTNPTETDPANYVYSANSGDSASGDGYGGAILCENGSSPHIENCVFINNVVTGGVGGDGASGFYLGSDSSTDGQWGGHGGDGSGYGYGGAVACMDSSSPTILSCVFEQNQAYGGLGGDGGDGSRNEGSGAESWGGNGGDGSGSGIGGAIYVDTDSLAVIENCTFFENISSFGTPGQGGTKGAGSALDPVARDGRDGQILNYDDVAGGAIAYNTGANGTVKDSVFEQNATVKDAETDYDFELRQSVTSYIAGMGGAIYLEDECQLLVRNCDFIENFGSAIYAQKLVDLTVNTALTSERNNFISNTGAISGSAVFMADETSANFVRCVFNTNKAESFGGAIAMDGDLTISLSTFSGNSAGEYGGAVYLYAEDPNTPLSGHRTLQFASADTSFSGNTAQKGGAIYLRDFEGDLTDSYVVGNSAEQGGGMHLSVGSMAISGGIVGENIADGKDAQGGGILSKNSLVRIENCEIRNNKAVANLSVGGGICFYGADPDYIEDHILFNCLLFGNEADFGGATAFMQGGSTDPVLGEITNCTFADNIANDYGSAIYCDNEAGVDVIYSVFAGNNGTAVYEKDVLDSIIGYSLFFANVGKDYGFYDTVDDAVYTYKGESDLEAIGFTEIVDGDPAFVSASTGEYYLTQDTSSAAWNAGDVNADQVVSPMSSINLGDLTTSTDLSLDDGLIDYGYHYPLTTPEFTVTIESDGNGKFKVGDSDTLYSSYSATYAGGETVAITAVPSMGYVVQSWSGGTDDDSSFGTTNSVLAGPDKTIKITFRQPNTLVVPGPYPTIQSAIDAAEPHDIVVISPSTEPYRSQNGILINKPLTLTGANPDDPSVVASTIIEQDAGPGAGVGRCFNFRNVGPETVLSGFTIQNWGFTVVPPKDPETPGTDGVDGFDAYGGGIELINASPIIRNCVIRNCHIRGSVGANGTNGDESRPDGGDGGRPGGGYGGGIAIRGNSHPKIYNCVFENNYADGNVGGNGGDGHSEGGAGGYGGGAYHFGDIDNPPLYTVGSGHGGAAYIGDGSKPLFESCSFIDNQSQSGTNGISGQSQPSGLRPEPTLPWQIDNFGGAVFCGTGSEPTFRGCTFMNNSADTSLPADNNNDDNWIGYGGAIAYENGAKPVIENCTFDNNTANVGGAIYGTFSNVMIIDSLLEDNVSSVGGGIYHYQCGGLISGTTFERNLANASYSRGGGVFSFNDMTRYEDCVITDNVSRGSGGGIYFGGSSEDETVGDSEVFNCLITNNTATRDGAGASVNWYSTPDFINCTIADNTVFGSPGYGGGISVSYSCDVFVKNSIVYGNNAGFGSQLSVGSGDPYSPWPSSLEVRYSDVELDNTPPPLEFVLMVDATGSMWDDIDEVKAAATTLFNKIVSLNETYRFGIVSYRDYPGDTGVEGDWPYRYVQPFTASVQSANSMIQTIEAGGGGDGPESLYTALMSVIDPARLEADLNANNGADYIDNTPPFGEWSTGDVKRVIVVMTDAPPHETEPVVGYTAQTIVDAATNPELPISIFPVFIGSNTQALDDYDQFVESTGGTVFRADEATDVVPAIIDAIELVSSRTPIHVEENCILNDYSSSELSDWLYQFETVEFPEWKNVYNNISSDPCFVEGPLGEYYLSQIMAGDPSQSLAVDAGDPCSPVFPLDYTTRTDNKPDEVPVDMGFHYPLQYDVEACSIADLNFDGIIDVLDIATFAENWAEPNCVGPDWCGGSDLVRNSLNSQVDFEDFSLIADCWRNQDTVPPVPNPAEWAQGGEPNIMPSPNPGVILPNAIIMTAQAGEDNWGGPVSYYFECLTPGDGCDDSGWQSSPTYIDYDLVEGVRYSYTVRMRDNQENTTANSVTASKRFIDDVSPRPNPAQWNVEPSGDLLDGSYMAAKEAVDVFFGYDVEYFFNCVSGPDCTLDTTDAADSGWQSSNVYTATGLTLDETYGFTVTYRDTSSLQNTTEPSELITVMVGSDADRQAPEPNPSTWSLDPTTADGATYIEMEATQAVDPEGSGVEYFFDCTAGPGCTSGMNDTMDSGWQDDFAYRVENLTLNDTFTYKVISRDKAPAKNTTDPSVAKSVTVGVLVEDNEPPTPNPSVWSEEPFSSSCDELTMSVVTSSDIQHDVQYFFDCYAGPGCTPGDTDPLDSGWTSSRVYVVGALNVGEVYSFRAAARDTSATQNQTGWTSTVEITVGDGVDCEAPTPNPAEFSTNPRRIFNPGVASWVDSMTATAAADENDVEYYFDCSGSGCPADSGWQDGTSYVVPVTGEFVDTSWRVRYRDTSPQQNTGDWSPFVQTQ